MANIIWAVFFGWIVVLTYIVFSTRSHYQRLITRTKRHSIDEILDILIKQNEDIQKSQDRLKKETALLEDVFRSGFHKIGLVRFDAFGRTEGEQSFVLAFLNDKNNGYVLNFIYIHDGIRVYSKKVIGGKGDKHELSEEEKKAIQQAE